MPNLYKLGVFGPFWDGLPRWVVHEIIFVSACASYEYGTLIEFCEQQELFIGAAIPVRNGTEGRRFVG